MTTTRMNNNLSSDLRGFLLDRVFHVDMWRASTSGTSRVRDCARIWKRSFVFFC